MLSLRALHILPLNSEAEKLYRNHGTFHEGDSGLDLFVLEDQTIKAGETDFIKLGIKGAAYDENGANVSFLIMARSSISKTPLRLSNCLGLIDAGYRGEMMCCVDNIKTTDYEVKKGDRLIQAVFFDGKPFSLKIVDSLTETTRGEGGWGSTTRVNTNALGNKIPLMLKEEDYNEKKKSGFPVTMKDENNLPLQEPQQCKLIEG